MAQRFSKQFYHSREWKEIRESILKRDNYLCQEPNCEDPAEEVHHIIHVTPANINIRETHAPNNLISLCRNHHCRKHDRDRYTSTECSEEYYFDKQGVMRKASEVKK